MSEPAWIEWFGGERPVDYDTYVEVKYLGPPREAQHALDGCFAGFYCWQHTDENDDIIAYRVPRLPQYDERHPTETPPA